MSAPAHWSGIQHESSPPSISYSSSVAQERADHVHTDTDADTSIIHTHDTITDPDRQGILNKRQRNAIVPAVNLPPEVLATIFEFACSLDGDDWIANIEPATQRTLYRKQCPTNACAVTPLFIGAICSTWRSIAWGAPPLWKSIALLYHDGIDEKLAEMLTYWLSKSGKLPLTLKLLESQYHVVAGESFAVMDVIGNYVDRLHTLDLFLPCAWEADIQIIAYSAPLTCLTLRYFVAYTDDNPTLEFGDMFADAEQLREVTLHGYCTAYIELPWDELESLESEYTEAISQLFDALRLCPYLRRFSVLLKLKDYGLEVPSSVMRHDELEVFEVFYPDEILHPDFFRVLELPALRTLVLRLNTEPDEWASWLPPFLSRVAETLETLHLSYVTPLEEEDMLTILRVVPKLRNLVLLDPPADSQELLFTQRALNLLNPAKYKRLGFEGIGQLDGGARTTEPDERGNGQRCLVPNLETFEFRGKIAFPPHALVEFLVARWRGLPQAAPSRDLDLGGPYKSLEGPRTQAASEPPPNLDGASARLRSVTFHIPEHCFHFEDPDVAVVQGLRLEGMHLEFVKRPYQSASCMELGFCACEYLR